MRVQVQAQGGRRTRVELGGDRLPKFGCFFEKGPKEGLVQAQKGRRPRMELVRKAQAGARPRSRQRKELAKPIS